MTGKKIYRLFEQQPSRRTINRTQHKRRTIYQYSLESESQRGSVIKHGRKYLMYQTINEHGFNDELRTDQWKRFSEEIIPHVESKDFRRKRKQAIWSISMKINFIEKTTKIDFTNSIMEKKIVCGHHSFRTSQRSIHIINKQVRSSETLRLIAKWQEITKPGNLWFLVNNNLNRQLWVCRQPDK